MWDEASDYDWLNYGPGSQIFNSSDGRSDNDSDTDDDLKYEEDGSCQFKKYTYSDELLDELAGQRESGEFLDVVVEVEDREFPCHRAVLATTPYFKTMLFSNLAESKSKVVKLNGIDSASFSRILDFLYTGEIRISEDDVQDILLAAHMLQIDQILEYCRRFIQDNLSPSNCVGVMRLADMYELADIKVKARQEALSHFSEVGQNEEFFTLSTQELLDLLTDDGLQATNEDDVVHSVIRWLDHDRESRKKEVFAMLQEIRLSYVGVGALKKLESHPVVLESVEYLEKVKAAREEHNTNLQQVIGVSERHETEYRPRYGISDDLGIIVGGWKNSNSWDVNSAPPIALRSVICVDPDRQQFYHITDLPTAVAGYMSVTSTGRRLYVTGGRVEPLNRQDPSAATSRQAFQYDFLTDTWTKLPDMPCGRAGHQSVVVDGKLFLVGGDVEWTSEEEASLFRVDYYDLNQDAWMKPSTAMEHPPIDRQAGFKATACGNKLVLFHTHYSKLYVNAFDVKTESWAYSKFDNLHWEARDILAVKVSDQLYIRSVEGYNRHIFYAYDVTKEALFKRENAPGFVGNFLLTRLKGGFLVDRDKGVMDYIAYFKFDGKANKSWYMNVEISLPYAMFGLSFLDAKKSSTGWYCRDLAKLDTVDE